MESYESQEHAGYNPNNPNILEYEADTFNAIQKLLYTDPSDEDIRTAIEITQNAAAELFNQLNARMNAILPAHQVEKPWPIDPALLDNPNAAEPAGHDAEMQRGADDASGGYEQNELNGPVDLGTKEPTSLVSAQADKKGTPPSEKARSGWGGPFRVSDLTDKHLQLLSLVADVDLEEEYNQPYNVLWPAKYNVSEGQIRAVFAVFIAKDKLCRLHSNNVLRPGDKFMVQTESTGVVTDRFMLFRRWTTALGFHLEFVSTPGSVPDPSLVGCQGPRDIVKAVLERFSGDQLVNCSSHAAWPRIHVYREDVYLGTCEELRENVTLWRIMTYLWAKKQGLGLTAGRRHDGKAGICASLPPVSLKAKR